LLYYKLVKRLGEVRDSLDFPPNNDEGFSVKRIYEESKGFLQITQKLDVTEDDEAVVFTVYI